MRAELNEMGAFQGRLGEKNAIVGDDADLLSVYPRETCSHLYHVYILDGKSLPVTKVVP